MVNISTYLVNIHPHPSIQHTMRNSRVTGTIANNDEETTQYFVTWYPQIYLSENFK